VRVPRLGAVAALLWCAQMTIAPAAAQPLRLPSDAEVRSVTFRFQGPHELVADDLTHAISTTGSGPLRGLHGALAWIPGVPDPVPHAFVPLVLQEDVLRLRRYYRRQGFLSARVAYDVKVHRDHRQVDVVFLIEEGEPLLLRSLRLAGPDGSADVALVGEARKRLRSAWEKIRREYIGHRFRESAAQQLQSHLDAFLRDQGYPDPRIEPRAMIDSLAGQVDLVWQVTPGARSRLGAIEVEGVRSVSEAMVRRQTGLTPGDWTSRHNLDRARTNLLSVDLFRQADLTLDRRSAPDSALPVRVRVAEDRPRFTTLEGGYITDGAGVSGQTRWTHPNFTGGARSLNAIFLFQSGWLATSSIEDQLVRGTVALTQPYVVAPELSFSFGPSYEFRDGHLDRSTAWSLYGNLVWRFNRLQSAAVRYEYTDRTVDVSRGWELAPDLSARRTLDLFGKEGLIDSLSTPVRTSVFKLSTTVGGLDDIARPRHGAVLKPSLMVTGPPVLGNVEFSQGDLQVTAFLPAPGRSNTVMFRGDVAALWPFGKSIPQPGENPAVPYIQLRDYILTAGGSGDVRGYANRMLGPKVPRIDATVSGADTVLTSDRYVEVGGMRRWTATIEARIGLPWISRDVFAHVFCDAGRVWTSDDRFRLNRVFTDQQRVFYTTGGGIGYYTPVGAIRFDIGYKLNPSVLDQRKPQDVLDAILAGRPPSAAPVDSWRRFGASLALGLYF
jgi:outer membrane protein insertion porin family